MIPVNEPLIGEKEHIYVKECLDTGWISSGGRFIGEFENGFAQYCGRSFGIAVNNGSNALIAAFRALELPAGSEVIIPSFTIISCALACVYNGLVPVFTDAEPETWNMDPDRIEEKITKHTKALMVVHIYGHPVDMDRIRQITEKYDLRVIEDFAEAIGAEFKSKRCGCFGDISCASFYANKTITTGEGGMCLTDSPVISEKIKSIRNLCFQPQQRFLHEELGYNFRMTNIQAAIGLAQLERIDEHIKKKIAIARTYSRFLKELERNEILRLPVEKPWAKNIFWMYGVVLNKKRGIKALEIQKRLEEKGIQTRSFFFPMHLQPVFQTMTWFTKERLEVSENLFDYGFYLPSGLTLTEEDMAMVAAALKEILNGI
ncbi:MAG TPA: DegT/DnrJ/EryC1/StrS family aminotransferase [Candidatus Kapabacteria bacterium]|nr:DegT/DnrJ/EryC1/StrS family aminotransferase [Candidatus Kapabacteria bacterium]